MIAAPDPALLTVRRESNRVASARHTQHPIEAISNAVYLTTHHDACRRLNRRFPQPEFSRRG
jgi:hypothetical protein